MRASTPRGSARMLIPCQPEPSPPVAKITQNQIGGCALTAAGRECDGRPAAAATRVAVRLQTFRDIDLPSDSVSHGLDRVAGRPEKKHQRPEWGGSQAARTPVRSGHLQHEVWPSVSDSRTAGLTRRGGAGVSAFRGGIAARTGFRRVPLGCGARDRQIDAGGADQLSSRR